MAERSEETFLEKIVEKIHAAGDSSSSDSDDEKRKSSDSSLKPKIYRLFGREKPVHHVLGGGKCMNLSSSLFFNFLIFFLWFYGFMAFGFL